MLPVTYRVSLSPKVTVDILDLWVPESSNHGSKQDICVVLHIGIMESRMETTVVYWGYIRIMVKKMEATT